MIDTPKCPKCGADVSDFTVNKRRQLVGKCLECGRWGNLGKQKDSEEGSTKDAKQAQQQGAHQPQDKAATGARAGKRSGARGKRGIAKPAGSRVRGRQPRELKPFDPASPAEKRSFWNRVRDVLDTEL